MSTILGPFISNDVGTETDHDNDIHFLENVPALL